MAEENQIPLPKAKEIRKLPRWAQVAFAARCARRVLPLFGHFWQDTAEANLVAVTLAVSTAENSAAISVPLEIDPNQTVTEVVAASAEHFSVFEAETASAAAAHFATEAANATTLYDAANVAATAVDEAAKAAKTIPGASKPTCKAIVADFNTLKQLAQAQHWTDATPVPPSVFGPLWPEGAPAGWPAIEEETVTPSVVVEAETTATNTAKPTEKPKRLGVNLQFLVRGDVPADEIAQDIFELYAAMNEQNLAHGGPGLTIEEFRFLIGAPVGAGVQ